MVLILDKHIEFLEKEAVIHLVGTTDFLSLKREIRLPYEDIKLVYMDAIEPPLTMLRIPGTSEPFHVYEGSFLYQNEWYFLSLRGGRGRSLLCIDTNGKEKYHHILLDIEEQEHLLSEFNKRIG